VLLHAKHCASGEVFTSVFTLEGKQITYSLASSLENSSLCGRACVLATCALHEHTEPIDFATLTYIALAHYFKWPIVF